MKKAAVLSFSERGEQLAKRVAEILAPDYRTEVCARGGIRERMEALFRENDALVFVGACGIAVRFIAPYVVSKVSDPAVIVLDERGKHVLSLLSGHIGGANQLTFQIAAAIGADPVVTTATDVNGRFSADSWAAKNGCAISDMQAAKRFSAAILTRDLPALCEFELEGSLPDGLYPGDTGDIGLYIGIHQREPFTDTLRLIPKEVCLGIGCKRGTPAEKISAAVSSALQTSSIDPRSVCSVASIDVKKDEEGLLAYAGSLSVSAQFYSAETLNAVPGTFAASEFVRRQVGTDNVCERAALCAAGDAGEIIIHKTAADGVTVAAALRKRRIRFE